MKLPLQMRSITTHTYVESTSEVGKSELLSENENLNQLSWKFESTFGDNISMFLKVLKPNEFLLPTKCMELMLLDFTSIAQFFLLLPHSIFLTVTPHTLTKLHIKITKSIQ